MINENITSMKKLCVLILLLGIPFALLAQEKTKQKEIGLRFYNFDRFGLHYKFGSNKMMWRLGGSFLGADYTEFKNTNGKSTMMACDLGLTFGLEKIVPINKNFDFRVGADLRLGFSYDQYRYDAQNSIYKSTQNIYQYTPGLNAVLGFNYTVLDHLVIGAEFTPSVFFQYDFDTKKVNGDIFNSTENISNWKLGADITQTSLALCIAYKFNRGKNEK
jgi:hypothetical protein